MPRGSLSAGHEKMERSGHAFGRRRFPEASPEPEQLLRRTEQRVVGEHRSRPSISSYRWGDDDRGEVVTVETWAQTPGKRIVFVPRDEDRSLPGPVSAACDNPVCPRTQKDVAQRRIDVSAGARAAGLDCAAVVIGPDDRERWQRVCR